MKRLWTYLTTPSRYYLTTPLYRGLGGLLIALFFVFFVLYQIDKAQAQPTLQRTHLPAVANGQAPPLVILDGGDNTFVNAVVIPGPCVLLAYIDRDDGNRLKVKQDAGTHLIDVPLPPEAQQAVDEAVSSFTAPGDKQADGALLVYDNQLVLYYTSRGEDDPTGSFNLRRLTMPLPECVQ